MYVCRVFRRASVQTYVMRHIRIPHIGHMIIVVVTAGAGGGRIATAAAGRLAIFGAIPIGLREIVPCGGPS